MLPSIHAPDILLQTIQYGIRDCEGMLTFRQPYLRCRIREYVGGGVVVKSSVLAENHQSQKSMGGVRAKRG